MCMVMDPTKFILYCNDDGGLCEVKPLLTDLICTCDAI